MSAFNWAGSILMMALPLAYLLAALIVSIQPTSAARRLSGRIVYLAGAAGFAVLVLRLLPGAGDITFAWLSPSKVGAVMLALVGFIGVILHHFSERYLDGEPRRQHYDVTLLLTLTSVATVLISDHLLVVLLGWTAISLCLHGLLTFYPNRPRAALAAHKKFLFARVAELALLAAFIILRIEHGTWSVSEIVARYPVADMGLELHIAAVLIAFAALIKCAQLPTHGWLMQVVEAPTPISALLHAGIVNLGGYLLMLFGPVWLQSGPAQWLILLVAGATAVIAALSMAMRVSVKVKLAWSTCAQMALMLIECALGLFELALLHLVAHSCYKAYSFLSANTTTQVWRCVWLAPPAPPTRTTWMLSAIVAIAITGVAAVLSNKLALISPWLFMAAALTAVLAEQGSARVRRDMAFFIPLAIGIVAFYTVLKSGAGYLLGDVPAAARPVADIWVSLLVVMLFIGHIMLRHVPGNVVSRRLARRLYAGFYLDEWATYTTLAIWPLRFPTQRYPVATDHAAPFKSSSS
ncbi:NADH-quinone oxidoreductase subunit L [Neopusillimonas maritima]|nr:NADH-quinone oxidoreductase subunit L [Neopusillimonas maritima]